MESSYLATLMFPKALNSFQKEDPTFRRFRPESGQLDGIGKPHVIFQEIISRRAEFDYLHKKQSGRQGTYARIMGKFSLIEPLLPDSGTKFGFKNMLARQAIPSNFVPAGYIIGNPVENIRIVMNHADEP
ncbi:elongation factor G [Striga asiatica]|uniref:Elongation factor G n=1 Tax=Striga asiatica TaxID=4170 RepID=A0A5A7RDH4_STRAF|nr:elongation factor G [Striga asiatica]